MNNNYIFKISAFFSALFLFLSFAAGASAELSLDLPFPERIVDLYDDNADYSGRESMYTLKSRLNRNFIEGEFKSFLAAKGFFYRKDKELSFDGSKRLRFDRENAVIDINLFDLPGRGTRIEIERYLALESPVDLKDIYSLADERPLGAEDAAFPDYSHYNKFKIKSSKSLAPVDIPPPPDSMPLAEESFSSCGSGCAGRIGPGKAYLSKNTSKQVGDFYQKFFKKNGFEVRKDMGLRLLGYSRIRFERSDMAVEVYLVSRADGSCAVRLVEYANRDDTTAVEADPFVFAVLPKKDNVKGADFDDIPRPQGSVRWSGTAVNNNVSYLVPMTVLEAREFYLKGMLGSGWDLIYEMETGKVFDEDDKGPDKVSALYNVFVGAKIDLGEVIRNSYMFEFHSASAEAKIMIYQNYIRKDAGSIVDIFYREKRKRR